MRSFADKIRLAALRGAGIVALTATMASGTEQNASADDEKTGAESPHAGVSVAAALDAAVDDLKTSKAELNRTHNRIETERLDLVRQIRNARNTVTQLESKAQSARSRVQRLQRSLEATRTALTAARKTRRTIVQSVTEHRRAMDALLTPSEAQAAGKKLKRLDELLQAGNQAKNVDAVSMALEMSFEHIRVSLGGNRFAGAALTADGTRIEGMFARFGPVSYFKDKTPEYGTTGIAFLKTGNQLPTVYEDIGTAERARIGKLVKTGRGDVPVDLSGGNAVRLARDRGPPWEHLRQGGLVMVPLLLLAACCLVMAVMKIVELARIATCRPDRHIRAILDALEQNDPRKALDLTRGLRRPLAPVIQEGIAHRNASRDELDEVMYEQVLGQMPALERFLTPLAVCASAAPLLGLLGTVTGMIHTFRLITLFGTGDAQVLSSGISEALVTTETGLAIAIPALLLHAWFSRRVRHALAVTRQSAVMFVNGLKMENPEGE